MDLECFLALVPESEFRMHGLSFPYLSERPGACLECRTRSLALLIVRNVGEVLLRECPHPDPVISVAALICPGVLTVDNQLWYIGLIGAIVAAGLAWKKVPLGAIVILTVVILIVVYSIVPMF